MPLTGALVNFGAIVVGGSLGLLFRKGLKQKYMDAVMYVLAFVIFGLAVSYVLKSQQILVLIISVVIGVLLGTLLKLDDRLNHFGSFLEKKIKIGNGNFSEGFVSCTILYCVGAMAITGSIQGGLNGDHTIIYAKSIMDGISSVFFASSLGVGVLFSAIPVLLYQGAIALAASALAPVLDMNVVTEMCAAGGVALMALAVNMTGIKKFKVADILPAIFLPIAIMPLMTWINSLI